MTKTETALLEAVQELAGILRGVDSKLERVLVLLELEDDRRRGVDIRGRG